MAFWQLLPPFPPWFSVARKRGRHLGVRSTTLPSSPFPPPSVGAQASSVPEDQESSLILLKSSRAGKGVPTLPCLSWHFPAPLTWLPPPLVCYLETPSLIHSWVNGGPWMRRLTKTFTQSSLAPMALPIPSISWLGQSWLKHGAAQSLWPDP